MIRTTIKEMEPHTKQRFHFAVSSFSRVYGVGSVTSQMIDFCFDWATAETQAPLDGLVEVDMYFSKLWSNK